LHARGRGGPRAAREALHACRRAHTCRPGRRRCFPPKKNEE
jgi:hypothetical protein